MDPSTPNLLAGRWVAPSGTRTRDAVDPHDDAVLATVPLAGADEAKAAVEIAAATATSWAATAAAERAALLRRWADALAAAADELVDLQVREVGRLEADARGGVEAAIGTLHELAVLGPLHGGRVLQGAPAAVDLVRRAPRGVAAVLAPWNDPVAVLVQGVGANLAVGNVVVAKPSERAALCSLRALDALVDAGVPAGVLGVLTGDAEAGAALVAERSVDVVVFTGSVESGLAVQRRACGDGRRFPHLVLELGGKDALVVDEGVDPAWAAEQCATGAFANAGQLCVGIERVYVHEAVADPFVEALAERAARWPIGPLVDRAHRAAVHGHVAAAVAGGARALVGGQIPDGPGAWYPPTVLTGVDDTQAVLREETFGPVAPVRVVGSFDEGIELANSSDLGLAATVLTPSPAHADRAWRELRAGTVKVNAVFGGAPFGSADPVGLSGRGAGYGPALLDELTRSQALHRSPLPVS